MFAKRVLTALVLLPLVLGAIIYGEKTGTAVVIAIASAIGVYEYLRLSSADFSKGEEIAVSLLGALISFSYLAGKPLLPGAVLAIGLQIYAISDAYAREPSKETLGRIANVAAALVFVALFLGYAVTVSERGYQHVLFIMFLVMSGDTGAYITGTLIGRHKLAPRISPKKTIEGSLGGMLATALVGVYASSALKLGFTWQFAASIAIAVNITAQVGDLVESHLKRAAGIKDSGTIFPGHGGMLDRIDAFLPTLPLYAAILSLYGG